MAMSGLNIRKAVGRGLFVMMAPIIGLFGNKNGHEMAGVISNITLS
jgi:hypothetical protein